MPHQGDGPGATGEPERVARHSEALQSNWARTLSDMQAMAEDRENKGFETLTIPAGDTTPLSPAMGEHDTWGLSHVVPGDDAEAFEAVSEPGAFEETAVYQLSAGGFVFLVTECIDLVDDVVVFIAGSYDMRHAAGLVRTAMERGTMYTHVKTLDHTQVGTIEHDDPSDFFPDPEAFYAYGRGG